MADLTLYGNIDTSRTWWTAWICAELGLEIDNVPMDYNGDAIGSDDYRALNPNCRIPTLTDGDLVVWESMAINLYLAKKYGDGIWRSPCLAVEFLGCDSHRGASADAVDRWSRM